MAEFHGSAAVVNLYQGEGTGGTWTNGSSRTWKSNFRRLDLQGVIEHVASLPILRWNYTGSDEGDHIGPMAEDFYAAFGVGDSEKYISTVDADGVALAAIQALTQKLGETESQIQSLQSENAELTARLQRLEALVLDKSRR